ALFEARVKRVNLRVRAGPVAQLFTGLTPGNDYVLRAWVRDGTKILGAHHFSTRTEKEGRNLAALVRSCEGDFQTLEASLSGLEQAYPAARKLLPALTEEIAQHAVGDVLCRAGPSAFDALADALRQHPNKGALAMSLVTADPPRARALFEEWLAGPRFEDREQ